MSLQQPVQPGCSDVMDPASSCDNTLNSILTLPYCLQAPQSVGQYWNFPRFNCTFWDAIDGTNVQVDNSISLATRVSKYKQNYTCIEGADTCSKIWTSLLVDKSGAWVSKEFTVGPENFTLLVDNNAYASTSFDSEVDWFLEAAALNTTGKLLVASSDLGHILCNESNSRGLEPTRTRFGTYPSDQTSTSPCYIQPTPALDGSNYDTFIIRDLVCNGDNYVPFKM